MRGVLFTHLIFITLLLFVRLVICQETCLRDSAGVCASPARGTADEELSKAEYEEKNPYEGAPSSELDGFQDVAGADLGVPQELDPRYYEKLLNLIRTARTYMRDVVDQDRSFEKVRALCRNTEPLCAFWAAKGECEANPIYMKKECAPICQSCEHLHVETKCPLQENQMSVWKSGDLNRMFKRIIGDPQYKSYNPTVLSRPTYALGDTKETAEYILGPWIISLENFLLGKECEQMVALGHIEGFERSGSNGEIQEDGSIGSEILSIRTSETSWCQNECFSDVTSKNIMARIADLTQIPEENSEHLQFLKYTNDQLYETHHDYINLHESRQCGVRILTVFLYLNSVDEGGGTNFPHLDLTVMPKCGRALIWPSVLNDAPDKMDKRTEHQALPVINGTKYAVNAWLHQRDYKGPYENGCC